MGNGKSSAAPSLPRAFRWTKIYTRSPNAGGSRGMLSYFAMAVWLQAPLSPHHYCHLLPLPHQATSSLSLCLRTFRRTPALAPRIRTPLQVTAMAKRRSLSFLVEEIASAEDLHFEPPLRIVEYPDPRLRARNKRINTFDDNLRGLVEEMFGIMYRTDGIGLSAPQVGMNLQLMVFNPAGERGQGEEFVLVNPRITKLSNKTAMFNEGCLSFPGIYADIGRPVTVKIDARNIKGEKFTVSLSGLPSRVFQHEFDHLQGTLFFERMDEDVLDDVRAQLKALEKKYEESTGLSSPENIDGFQTKKTAVAVGFGKA